MKKLLPVFLLLFVMAANAQNFEGTIRWSMKMDITDPEQKAKMDAQMQKTNDPATQAKMKEMQAKMNDPQMKAMMDANPQMKAQMERMMQMQSGDMSAMMPKSMTIMLKEGNVLTKTDGGPMAMEMLYLKDKNLSYRIDRANKTYSAMNQNGSSKSGPPSSPPKVTKTSETRKILNYNCTKYLVESTEMNRTVNQTFWTTTEIKDIDFKSMAKQRISRGQSMYFEGMDGVPLRIEMATPEANMIMEVAVIQKGSLNADDFKIPSDFKETQSSGATGRP